VSNRCCYQNGENGKKRFCTDYSQTINLFAVLDAYSLPKIKDIVNKLAKYKVFSSFDLKTALHQLGLQETDLAFTVFEVFCGSITGRVDKNHDFFLNRIFLI